MAAATTQRIWLVTGTTSGIGAALVPEIVSRGDKVIATGRNAETRLASLRSDNVAVLDLDLDAGREAIDKQAAKALDIWGRVDVLFNNAGMSALSTIEDADDEYVMSLFRTNLFGTWHLTQSLLPHFRARGSGAFVFISSAVAWGRLPFVGTYAMTKAALDALAEHLDIETRHLGLQTLIFEPGSFSTQLAVPRPGDVTPSLTGPKTDTYQDLFQKIMTGLAPGPENVPGDLGKAVKFMTDCVRGEGVAEGKKVPLRLPVGRDAWRAMKQKSEEHVEICKEWENECGAMNDPAVKCNELYLAASSIKPENYPF